MASIPGHGNGYAKQFFLVTACTSFRLPAPRVRGCLSFAYLLLLLPLHQHLGDSTDWSVTTSGTQLPKNVQPGERNRFHTPTSVLKQNQLPPYARCCSAEHRTNCFKHTAREAGCVGSWVFALDSVLHSTPPQP